MIGKSVNGVFASPLDVAAHISAVQSPESGAVAMFLGQVRNHDPDMTGAVVALEYSAHPDADVLLAGIIQRFVDRSAAAGVEVAIAASHRVGLLGVGDVALVACVASAHREAAFRVCRELVEAIKAELPIWKNQHGADGSRHWVGL